MDAYLAGGDNNVVPVPGITLLNVFNPATTRRGFLFYFLLTVPATGLAVGDNEIVWRMRRSTVPGTATVQVPGQFDLAAPASGLSAGIDHTAEPTFTTDLFPGGAGGLGPGLHQRNLFFWNAHQNGEFVIPAVVNAGIAFSAIHGSFNGLAVSNAHWRE